MAREACTIFGYRLVGTFSRYINRNAICISEAESKAEGIVRWKPKQFPHGPEFYEDYIKDFFDVRKRLSLWRNERHLCPNLQAFIKNFTQRTTAFAERIRKECKPRHNLSILERSALATLRERKVGYNISDKNFGPTLYSRDEYCQQCKLHLFDGKGTYELVNRTREEVLDGLLKDLRTLLRPLCKASSALSRLAYSVLKWADFAVKKKTLCKFYIIWKLHKKANARGVRSRPIASNVGFATSQLSHFLHCQLKDSVFGHQYVLKDSLSLIREIEKWKFQNSDDIYLLSADVAALYPSIDLERGIEALRWFIRTHTKFPADLQDHYLRFARFVLENNFVQCDELEGNQIFLQKVGTAMGTAFSATYATIFMIWLESPIMEEFQSCIKTYRRYIDDIFIAWIGSLSDLARFKARFVIADSNISLEWQNNETGKFQNVDFLDLSISVDSNEAEKSLSFGVYHKPGNSYAYLPYGSFHTRHTFKAWLKAEVVRLLTHSCTATRWLEECRTFY